MKRMLVTFFAAIFLSGGVSADENCSGMSNAEKSYCLVDLADFLEKQMVAAYISLDREIARLEGKSNAFALELRKDLQPSQIGFEAFREPYCSFEIASAMGGNGSGLIRQMCINDMTTQRTKYLRTITERLGHH